MTRKEITDWKNLLEFRGLDSSVDLVASPGVMVASIPSAWIHCEVSKPGKS